MSETDLEQLFLAGNLDVIFVILDHGTPSIEPAALGAWAYNQSSGVQAVCIDKRDGSGNIVLKPAKMKYKALSEIPRIIMENPVAASLTKVTVDSIVFLSRISVRLSS